MANNLAGFKTVPTKHKCRSRCYINLTRSRLNFNKAVYNHFYGDLNVRLCVKGNKLAVIKSTPETPDSVEITKHPTHDSYNGLSDKSLIGVLRQLIPGLDLSFNRLVRVYALTCDIDRNSIVFDFSSKNTRNIVTKPAKVEGVKLFGPQRPY